MSRARLTLRGCAFALLLALAPPAAAADDPPLPEPRDAMRQWPPIAQVQAALAGHPRMAQALARRQALRAGGDALLAGPNEVALRTIQARRRTDTPGGSAHEWQVAAERTLRSTAKREADARLADDDFATADRLVDQTRHALARELLADWLVWRAALAGVAFADAQAALAARLAAGVARRLAEGDASALEAELAAGEAERERAAATLARARAAGARLALRQRFPEIDGRTELDPVPQVPPAGERAGLEAAYLADHPDVMLARALASRAASALARTRAELRPDPSVGAYAGLDRGGAERVLGLTFSLPIAGAARDARVREAAAESDAASGQVSALERQLRADFDVLWSDATLRAEAAAALEAAARAQSAAAARVGRAWELGEASLSDWLQARRAAAQAGEQALGAGVEAASAAARLALELRRLPRMGPREPSADAAGKASGKP